MFKIPIAFQFSDVWEEANCLSRAAASSRCVQMISMQIGQKYVKKGVAGEISNKQKTRSNPSRNESSMSI